jgi:hypothetical protein
MAPRPFPFLDRLGVFTRIAAVACQRSVIKGVRSTSTDRHNMLKRSPIRGYPLTARTTNEAHLNSAVATKVTVPLPQSGDGHIFIRQDLSHASAAKPDAIRSKLDPLFLVPLITRHIQSAHMIPALSPPRTLIRNTIISHSQVILLHVPITARLTTSPMPTRSTSILMELSKRLTHTARLANPQPIGSLHNLVSATPTSGQRVAMLAVTAPMKLAVPLRDVLTFTTRQRTGTIRHVELLNSSSKAPEC